MLITVSKKFMSFIELALSLVVFGALFQVLLGWKSEKIINDNGIVEQTTAVPEMLVFIDVDITQNFINLVNQFSGAGLIGLIVAGIIYCLIQNNYHRHF